MSKRFLPGAQALLRRWSCVPGLAGSPDRNVGISFLCHADPHPVGRGLPPERAPKPASLVAGLSPLFLAAQGGAATDEVWFVGIFAIGAVVGLLVLAFQFVGRQRQPGVFWRRTGRAAR